MQSGERKLHLPFHASRTNDPTAVGVCGGVLQQGRFADPGFASQHQHRTSPLVSAQKELREPRTFGLAAKQRGMRMPQGGLHPAASITQPRVRRGLAARVRAAFGVDWRNDR
jgi:hypothetical protein